MLNIMLKVVLQMYSKMPTKPKICIFFQFGLFLNNGRNRIEKKDGCKTIGYFVEDDEIHFTNTFKNELTIC